MAVVKTMVGNPFGESLVLTANERLQRHHLRQLHRAVTGILVLKRRQMYIQ